MAVFESLGYCPFDEINQNQRIQWLELPEIHKGYRTALWNLVGPYLVCEEVNAGISNEPGVIFFGTQKLADKVLIELIKRYDFNAAKPIWIKRPLDTISQFVTAVVDKHPEIIISDCDQGKIAVVCDANEEGSLIMAYWDYTPNR